MNTSGNWSDVPREGPVWTVASPNSASEPVLLQGLPEIGHHVRGHVAELLQHPRQRSAAGNHTGAMVTAIRDTTLAWSDSGSGSTVVWAHPLTSGGLSTEAARHFGREPVVAGGHRLVRYDARGHGRSGGKPNPEDFACPCCSCHGTTTTRSTPSHRAAAFLAR